MLAEARQAMLLSRLGITVLSESDVSEGLLTGREALEMATLGGARVLGRTDIGSLQAGKCADFIAIKLSRLEFAGALHDPVAALVLCQPVLVDYNYVHGRPIVSDGLFKDLDVGMLVEAHNRSATRLVGNQ
jgi:cytosine/adenosine deaminase-related metal-dependent hydrolase